MAKVAFIQDFWNELPGVAALSASLNHAGHETQAFIVDRSRESVREIAGFAPDIAAFSCTTGAHRGAASYAAEVKSAMPKCIIVAGGPHPTFYPDFINDPSIDIICRGEGDDAIVDLAAAAGDMSSIALIPNLHTKTPDGIIKNQPRPVIGNLDSLPLPDYSLYFSKYKFLARNPSKMFITGRGCPFSCTFCFNASYRELYSPGGCPVRRMSPGRAIDMISNVKNTWGLSRCRFDDDVFALDKKWLGEFLRLYRERITLPFTCLVRANVLDTDMAEDLAASGCRVAQFGVESGNDSIRNNTLGKGVTRDDLIRCASLLRENGIRSGTFNMMNLPGENLLNGWETVFINRHIRANYPWCSLVQPYPGTELEKAARTKGLLPRNFSPNDIPVSYFRNSPIENPDREPLENLHKFFYLAVKAPILWPLIRALIRMPANAFFDTIFKTTYALRYSRVYGVPMLRVLKIGKLNKKSY